MYEVIACYAQELRSVQKEGGVSIGGGGGEDGSKLSIVFFSL